LVSLPTLIGAGSGKWISIVLVGQKKALGIAPSSMTARFANFAVSAHLGDIP